MYIIHHIQIYALQLCMECYLVEKSLLVVFQITAYGNLLALYWLTFYKLKCVFSQKSGCWWSCWASAWQDILRLSGESINTKVGTVKRHYKLGFPIVKTKMQQTKMLVMCQRFGDLFLFGLVWQYSTNQNQYNKGRFKIMATYLQQ